MFVVRSWIQKRIPNENRPGGLFRERKKERKKALLALAGIIIGKSKKIKLSL
jgi:hypothetical protein